ncbi:hypothetical protein J6590_016641 [Homalodisca vitripennis]|nr:hypothetical protein J6590_016641 [Homalodisca vitripennis]
MYMRVCPCSFRSSRNPSFSPCASSWKLRCETSFQEIIFGETSSLYRQEVTEQGTFVFKLVVCYLSRRMSSRSEKEGWEVLIMGDLYFSPNRPLFEKPNVAKCLNSLSNFPEEHNTGILCTNVLLIPKQGTN